MIHGNCPLGRDALRHLAANYLAFIQPVSIRPYYVLMSPREFCGVMVPNPNHSLPGFSAVRLDAWLGRKNAENPPGSLRWADRRLARVAMPDAGRQASLRCVPTGLALVIGGFVFATLHLAL